MANTQLNNNHIEDACQCGIAGDKSLLSTLENIPHELKELKQWGLWALVSKEGEKPAKRLMSPDLLRPISPKPKDYKHLEVFDVAFEKLRKRYRQQAMIEGKKWVVSGLGFVLTADDPFVIVDVDDCIVEGQLSAEAQEVIDHFNAPTEISHSGNGIHIICKGKLPNPACRKGNYEIYEKERFFALTGRFIHE